MLSFHPIHSLLTTGALFLLIDLYLNSPKQDVSLTYANKQYFRIPEQTGQLRHHIHILDISKPEPAHVFTFD